MTSTGEALHSSGDFEAVLRAGSSCLIALLLCGVSAVLAQGRSNTGLDTTTIRIATASDTVAVRVEIAATLMQLTRGLENRDTLAADRGMLFRFPAALPENVGHLTMYRMRFPIDVAFIDSAGLIVETLTLPPCTSQNRTECPKYASPKPFTQALEVNAGFFARTKIKPGDRLIRR
jgi:uncharacterized protein